MTQRDIDRPLFPTQGCMVFDFMYAPFDFVGETGDVRTFERIYDDCAVRVAWNGRHVIEVVDGKLVCNDPTKVVQIACGYLGVVNGRQYPDKLMKAPIEAPRDFPVQYTVVQFELGALDHYVLFDRLGMGLVFDSSPGKVNPWLRTGTWRGVQIWRDGL